MKAKPPDNRVLRPQTSRPWPRFFGLFLIAATFLAYLPALHNGFIWDDDAHLTANPCIVGPLGFKEIWTSSAATYYPLVLSSFWVQHAIWGLNPWPYHLVNIALHAACTVLLWLVLRRLQVRGAWFGAALWGLYPVQTESVAWITELKNTQSGLFYLLAIWFFLKWLAADTIAGRKGTERDYVLALLCAALAILSKTSTVMLPVVLGLVWWWRDGRWRWRNIFRLAPFFIIAAAASGWTIWEQQFHSGAVGLGWSQSRPERLLIAGKAVWFYLGKLLWPHPLIFIYPRWEIDASRPTAYLPILMLGVSLFLLWLNRRGRTGPVFFAFAYFVVLLFPVLGFFNVYFFRYSFVGDHFQYLASMGPLALAAAVIAAALDFFKKGRPFLEPALCGTLLLVLGALTWQQCGMYADVETLWRTTITRNPDCWLAHNNLGVILLKQGHWDEAIQHFERALKIEPDSADALNNLGGMLAKQGKLDEAIQYYERALQLKSDNVEAHNNLGAALADQGKLDEAIQHYKRALQLDPDYTEAHNNLGIALAGQGKLDEAIRHYERVLQLKPDYPEAHNNLGIALAGQGKPNEAIRHFTRALLLKPDYVEAHYNLGFALADQGRFDDAIRQYERALQLKPDYAEAHNNLGFALANQGKLEEAIQQYEQALRLKSDYADALINLGNALANQHKFDEAIRRYEQALQLKPDDPELHNNLGIVLLRQGRLAEAIPHFQQALATATAQGNTALAESIRTRLKSYPPALLQPQTP